MEAKKVEENEEIDSSLKCAIRLKKGRPKLSETEIEEIRNVFNLFAAEGTGLLNTNELKEAMRSLGTFVIDSNT